MTPEQKALCLELADFMETVPPERHTQKVYCFGPYYLSGKAGKLDDWCGTGGCSLGWMTVWKPQLFRVKFYPHRECSTTISGCVEALDKDGDWIVCDPLSIRCKVLSDLLGMNGSQQEVVFGPETMSPTEKANQIRELVNA